MKLWEVCRGAAGVDQLERDRLRGGFRVLEVKSAERVSRLGRGVWSFLEGFLEAKLELAAGERC